LFIAFYVLQYVGYEQVRQKETKVLLKLSFTYVLYFQAEHYLRIRSRRSSRRWIAALVKKLADVVWQMWDNEKETATLSIEVNRKIRAEYDQGIINLSNAAQNLARQPAEELMNKGLHYRQYWLRTMTAHRQYQETLRARNEPPVEILKGKGMLWWISKGKPSLEEYRAMGSKSQGRRKRKWCRPSLHHANRDVAKGRRR
jgi:hypothetical protein